MITRFPRARSGLSTLYSLRATSTSTATTPRILLTCPPRLFSGQPYQQQALTTTSTSTSTSPPARATSSPDSALLSPFDPPLQISRIHTHYCREPQLIMIEDFGILQGLMDPSRLLTKYLNIPFATVPTRSPTTSANGSTALTVNGSGGGAPAPPLPWKGIRDATVLGPMAPQPILERNSLESLVLGLPGPGFEFSERDCLNLNVFAPRCVGTRRAMERGLPVICYIHGGGAGEAGGGNAMPALDASNLVKQSIAKGKPVIVVTINYRMGRQGRSGGGVSTSSLETRLLTAGDGSMAEGEGEEGEDWALHDQRMALEWVRKHIHNFDGDPQEITLMGHTKIGVGSNLERSEKAGYHLLSPLYFERKQGRRGRQPSQQQKEQEHDQEQRLFKRAIMHSVSVKQEEHQGQLHGNKILSAPTSPSSSSSLSSSSSHSSGQTVELEPSSSVAVIKRRTEENSTLPSFTFMADACLAHMSVQDRDVGWKVLDRWIEFAYGDEEAEEQQQHPLA